ncbi:hypothetical protein V2I01_02290 [Micromonospora sp. BRA006-A]|nr:hypothetical protein [Micromonospora sp. BRA006-A]
MSGPDRRAWVEHVMGLPVSVHLRGPGVRDPAVEEGWPASWPSCGPPTRCSARIGRTACWAAARRTARPGRHRRPAGARGGRAARDGPRAHRRMVRRPPPAAAPGRHRLRPSGLVKGWAVERAAGGT